MKIKPAHHVTFEQAKQLKEKGLIADCKRYWVKYTNSEYKEMSDVELDNLDKEIGIGGNLVIPKFEQWQVVEWLWVEKGIWISVLECNDKSGFYWRILEEAGPSSATFNSPQEAYSAAFDYVMRPIPFSM